MSQGPVLQFALLAGFILAITLTLLTSSSEHLLRRMLQHKAPAQRARISWWMLVTPALAGIAYMSVTLAMPSVLHHFSTLVAECSAHTGSLWHMCVWHPSDNGQSTWLWGGLALLATYAFWLGARAAASLWRVRRTLATMLRLSWRPDDSGKLHILEADQPLALACGIGRGHILLSTSLLERLNLAQLQVVLAHERAHVAHRDVLYRLIAVVLSSIQLPGTRRRLLRDLELAFEQRCDLAAAKNVGSSIVVAETIVAVEKIFQHHARGKGALSMAFFLDFVPERVQALLSPGRENTSFLGLFLGLAVIAFCSLSPGWLHYFTESLIGILVH